MDLFADWLATKRGMLALLSVGASETVHAPSRSGMLSPITAITDAGGAAGDIRRDVDPEDVAVTLVGIFTVAGNPAQQVQAGRLLDLLMAGLRPSVAQLWLSRESSATNVAARDPFAEVDSVGTAENALDFKRP
jgi:hypothetical protein